MHSVRGRQVRHSIRCDRMQAMPSPLHVAARGKNSLGLPVQCRLLWGSSARYPSFRFWHFQCGRHRCGNFCTRTRQRNSKHTAKVCKNIFAWPNKLHRRLCRMRSRLFQGFHRRSSLHSMSFQHVLCFHSGQRLIGLPCMPTTF